MNKLRKARFFKKISQYQLAVSAHVHQSRISLIENGLAEPTEDEQKRIAKALDVKLEKIWKRD